MKKISIDFKNNAICFMLKNQQGTEFNPCLKNRKAFNGFIPGNIERIMYLHGILRIINFRLMTISKNQILS